MMLNRKELAREALGAALQLRIEKQINLVDPICIYDFAENLRIDLRFADIPSLEGLYSSTPRPTIVLGSDRPAGRRAYTCAHEIGHHHFGHGSRIDELRPEGTGSALFEPEEFLAQAFAGFLLMPKLAVCNAFAIRGWKIPGVTPEQIYRASNLFGVTYAGLIHHLTIGLHMLAETDGDQLLAVKLPSFRAQFCDRKRQLVFVDDFWKSRPIDLEVGDIVHSPLGSNCQGDCLIRKERHITGQLFEATQPGCGHISNPRTDWECPVRVSRHFYVGLNRYRHMEEVADE